LVQQRRGGEMEGGWPALPVYVHLRVCLVLARICAGRWKMESLLHMAVLGRGRLACSVVGFAGWRWRFVFALLPRHCQGWSSSW
jgi:hypothetical protein